MKHALSSPFRAAALLFLFASAAAIPAQAQAPAASILQDPWFDEQARKGLKALYDMDFGYAQMTFSEVSARYPDHPVGPYLETLLPWWAIQLEPDDTSQDDALLDSLDRVLAICDRRLKADGGDLDALFFKSGAHALRGRLHADRRRWLKAARDGQQALGLLQKVRQRDPHNEDLYFGIGLFDYLAETAPKQYRVLRPFAALFPVKGDRERGLRELERAMHNGRFVQAESAYALLQLYYVFEKDYPASLRYATWLRARHPDNSIFHLYEARIYERMGLQREARRAFQEALDRHAKGQSGYTDAMAEQALYLLARLEMRYRRHEAAIAHLDRLEQLNAHRTVAKTEYKGLSRLRRGMALDALGRRGEAMRCYRDVLAMGRDVDGSVRDRAKGYIKKAYAS